MIVKIIGACLVITATSATGFCWARRLQEHCLLLQGWLRVLEILQVEIFYQARLLPEVFRRVATLSPDHNFQEAFNSLAADTEYGSDRVVSELWGEMLCSQSPVLDKRDFFILSELGSYLGQTDRNDQSDKLKAAKAGIESNLRLAEAQRDSRTKIYRYLGFASGALVVLLLL